MYEPVAIKMPKKRISAKTLIEDNIKVKLSVPIILITLFNILDIE